MNDLIKLVKTYRLTAGIAERLRLAQPESQNRKLYHDEPRK